MHVYIYIYIYVVHMLYHMCNPYIYIYICESRRAAQRCAGRPGPPDDLCLSIVCCLKKHPPKSFPDCLPRRCSYGRDLHVTQTNVRLYVLYVT